MSRKKINWLDHVVSLFVVILGISIAFFLENNRERNRLKKQESEYITGLLDDLRLNASGLDTLISYNDFIFEAASELTNASLGDRINNDTLFANYINRIQYPFIFIPQRTTYESLKSSGQMTLISDFELRQKVIGLHEYFYVGAKMFDDAVTEQVRDYVKPYFMDNITYTSYYTIETDFLKDHYFRKMMFSYKGTHERRSNFYHEIKSQTDSLVVELERYSSW